jgi:hypothetical protein
MGWDGDVILSVPGDDVKWCVELGVMEERAGEFVNH